MDGAIPEELIVTNADRNRIRFPDNMRQDVIETVFEIDIDVLPPPPPQYQRPERPRAEMNEQRWFAEDENDRVVGEVNQEE